MFGYDNDPDLLPHVVVAEWLAEHHPVIITLDESVFVEGCGTKIAYTLGGLLRATSQFSKKNSPRCNSRLYRKDYRNARYLFRTKCFEKDSGGPYITRIQLMPGEEEKVSKREVKISCSCAFWKYWGPDYNAKTKGYLEGQPRGLATPPTRNPALKRKNLLCKHIAASAPVFNKLVAIDLEKAERDKKRDERTQQREERLQQQEQERERAERLEQRRLEREQRQQEQEALQQQQEQEALQQQQEQALRLQQEEEQRQIEEEERQQREFEQRRRRQETQDAERRKRDHEQRQRERERRLEEREDRRREREAPEEGER